MRPHACTFHFRETIRPESWLRIIKPLRLFVSELNASGEVGTHLWPETSSAEYCLLNSSSTKYISRWACLTLGKASVSQIFLDAFAHLYKRLCPSVGRSVGRSVRHARVETMQKSRFWPKSLPVPARTHLMPCIRPCSFPERFEANKGGLSLKIEDLCASTDGSKRRRIGIVSDERKK